jgi:predicted nucleic acid-binding protein
MDLVFADSNVFLDSFLVRVPTYADCDEILNMGRQRKIKLYTSSSCLLTVMYFLKKDKLSNEDIVALISKLFSFITLVSPNEQTFKTALFAEFTDLEDSVQYFTALSINDMNYFITSNTKHFKKATSQSPVLTPSGFIKIYNKK